MRKVLRVNPKTHLVCVPQEMVEDGMVGDVDSYPNAVTLTLVTPGASLEDVKASLERTLSDIEHRIRFAGRNTAERGASEPEPSLNDLRQKLTGGVQ
jgi:hypothetical protein